MILRGVSGGETTASDWAGKTDVLAKSSPVEIPSDANVKVQTKNGYEQISYKWNDGSHIYEVRWHTKTPGAPTGQGNTWVVSKIIPGTPTGKLRTEQILVGDNWIARYQWQNAIKAYGNGIARPEELKMLEDGHWKAP